MVRYYKVAYHWAKDNYVPMGKENVQKNYSQNKILHLDEYRDVLHLIRHILSDP